MKLILKRESKGYYTNQIDNFKITVSEWGGNWEGSYTDESKTVDKEYLLYHCFGSTKKEVVNQLIKFLNYDNRKSF